MRLQLCVFLLFVAALVNSKGFGPGEQDYGYVTVRPGAHMFWWLFHTTANVTDSSERPLIIWIAGGPGSSGSGPGNFWYVGPVDMENNPREHTWVKDYNILFVDSPVGSGFSYVEILRLLNNKNIDVAKDLVELTKGFYAALPKFKNTPLYVYGLSYGARTAVDYGVLLHEEIKLGKIDCNFKAVMMGSPWISPLDYAFSYGEILYQFGLIDRNNRQKLNDQANHTKNMYDEGLYFNSKAELVRMIQMIDQFTGGIDIYNLNKKVNRMGSFKETLEEIMQDSRNDFAQTSAFMNGPVKTALNIPSNVTWASQMVDLQLSLYVEVMFPGVSSVEKLLNDTDVEVHLCNGNMNLLVSTPGTLEWVDKLSWKDSEEYENAPRKTVWVNDTMEGYKKEGGRFHFYWINVAGNIAFEDNPVGTKAFLQSVTGV